MLRVGTYMLQMDFCTTLRPCSALGITPSIWLVLLESRPSETLVDRQTKVLT
jgi:hypothetical protein